MPQISTIQKSVSLSELWKPIPSSEPDLHISYRNLPDEIQICFEQTVKTTLERLICVLRDEQEIPKWNVFVSGCHLIEDISPDHKVYLLELRNEVGHYEMCYQALTIFEDQTRTRVVFENIEHPMAPSREAFTRIVLNKHQYTIDLVDSKVVDSYEGFDSRESLQTATSYYNLSNIFTYNIKLEISMDLSVAKLTPGEFIGEATSFRDTWVNLKRFLNSSELMRSTSKHKSNSMLEALSRKLTIGLKNRKFSTGMLTRLRHTMGNHDLDRPISSII
jgi:hypothetical protein